MSPGPPRATLVIRNGFGARFSPQDVADLVEMALEVGERRVVYLLAAIEPLGDLRNLGLVDALEKVQPDMSPRQTSSGHVVSVFNGISYGGVGVPTIYNPVTARVGKRYLQLARPTWCAGKFGVFDQEVNSLVFDRYRA
jgi:hypothetical protein